MGFHEVNFPDSIAYGATSGPGYDTGLTELRSGIEEAVARSSTARRRYNARYGLKDHSDIYSAVEFYIARLGVANGFRWKDWVDYATTATGTTHNPGDAAVDDEDSTIGTGDGTVTTFPLLKTYVSGSESRTRTITKPIAGTVVVAADTTGQTEGVDFTVNTTNGIVTFTTAPALGVVITAGCEFDVPVRFGLEVDATFSVVLEAFDNEEIADIPIIEIKNEDALSDEQFAGGAINHGDITATVSMTILQGLVHTWETSSGSPVGQLPDPDSPSIPTGGPYFFVNNEGSVALTINDDTGTLVVSVAAGTTEVIFLGVDGSKQKAWMSF